LAAPVDYAGPRTEHAAAAARRPLPASVRAALFFVGSAMALAALTVVVMFEEFVWEGGDQNYLTHFPFQAIWVLCGLGAASAAAALVRREHARGAALLALALNVLVAGFFARSYARALRGVREDNPNRAPRSVAPTSDASGSA
jgi:hypothetical protein